MTSEPDSRPEKLSLIDSVAGILTTLDGTDGINDRFGNGLLRPRAGIRDGAVYKEGTFAEISKDAWVQTLIG